jgi:hypothetical protein
MIGFLDIFFLLGILYYRKGFNMYVNIKHVCTEISYVPSLSHPSLSIRQSIILSDFFDNKNYFYKYVFFYQPQILYIVLF